jgi:hypothetical protein
MREARSTEGADVTEEEWLSSGEVREMLLRARYRSYPRKSRLFGAACCRRLWGQLGQAGHRAIETAERHADAAASDRELSDADREASRAHDEAYRAHGKFGSCPEWAAAKLAGPSPARAAQNVAWMAARPRRPPGTPQEYQEPAPPEVQAMAHLLRCIFGNPFRPQPSVSPSVLTWNDSLVVRLAEQAYEQRLLPAGHLDPQLLGVLADALEEAGAGGDLVEHLRGRGPHVRGCFVVDLLLNKE